MIKKRTKYESFHFFCKNKLFETFFNITSELNEIPVFKLMMLVNGLQHFDKILIRLHHVSGKLKFFNEIFNAQ